MRFHLKPPSAFILNEDIRFASALPDPIELLSQLSKAAMSNWFKFSFCFRRGRLLQHWQQLSKGLNPLAEKKKRFL